MLTILKSINLLMSVAEMVMGMFRDDSLREAGRNEVAAKNATRAIKARDQAYEKVKTFDAAVALAVSKLPDGGNK